MQRLSIGRTITVALIGLALALAAIAAIGVGNLYDARQRYEDRLASSYEVESASSRLLAAGVIEEVLLAATGRGAAARRREAADAFEEIGAAALDLAESDPETYRLIEARLAAQDQLRAAARRTRRGDRADPVASAVATARGLSSDIAERQRARRARSRDQAADDTRRATIIAAVAGGLALLAALSLVAGLIAAMRRPLDDLVGATRGLAQGEGGRVDPHGPRELRELGRSFNRMAADLESARHHLEDERLRLAVTIESLGDALIVCDPDGTIAQLNPRAEELLPDLRPGGQAQGADSPLPPLEQALGGEATIDRDGRTLSVTAARMGPDGEGAGVVWTVRDITERARLERLKSEFVSTASHELRSPLTSIKGFAELLSHSSGLSRQQREFLDVIVVSTNRLVGLVNELLEVARAEAGRIEIYRRPTEMGEIAREVATLMRPRLEEKGQTLVVDASPGVPRASADPVRVRQVLTNLVTNAHLYSEEGGRIEVRVAAEDGWVVAAVADDGIGMTADECAHVFDRFYRGGDGRYVATGTGLGLSIVKSLVDLHGGTIEVQSAPGEGSTFTVRLPRDPARGEGADGDELRGKRVLIVEDDGAVAELIAEQLSQFDVTTEIADSGDRALELLTGGGFDALTLDVLMPGMDGFELLRRLRADDRLARIPVVVVSVMSTDVALAGEWTVAKPIDAEQLADALGGAVAAGRTRAVVVARASLRPRLEPELRRLGLDFVWTTSATAAGRACEDERFELAVIDAGLRSPQAALAAVDLRGRRPGGAVVVVSAGDDAPGAAALSAELVPISELAQAVLHALGRTPVRD